MTKFVDLSQELWNGAAMWPQLATDVRGFKRTFAGIRSTGWGGYNHPGWYDMGQGFPFGAGIPQTIGGEWVGHLHAATHVDAPVYAIPEGITADQIPLENLYGTGVIIDMRHKGKWDTITAEDLEKATPKIEAGDFVVINTGWQKKHPRIEIAYEYYHNYPGLVPSAAEWLVNKKVKALAGTWPVCDHSLSFAPLQKNMPWLYNDYVKERGKAPEEEIKDLGGFEECLVMLLKNGISCIQNAGGDIDDVTGQRCKLCAWPFRLEHTDAAFVRLVAIIEE